MNHCNFLLDLAVYIPISAEYNIKNKKKKNFINDLERQKSNHEDSR